jgi:secreted PhoX family phosphatase
MFLRHTAAVSLGFASLRLLDGRGAHAAGHGYGDLIEDPAGILDLPKGFSYVVIARTGEAMDDGLLVPGLPDGMAAFPGPDGLTLVICNHELDESHLAIGPFANEEMVARLSRDRFFDVRTDGLPCPGGTTTFLYDTRSHKKQGHRLSLAGTLRNCAGGPTPWGSWLSCEETVARQGEGRTVDHGYNFEVPAVWGVPPVEPKPLLDMGRFNHEATAVDEASGIVYQTEDREDGLLYRYIPRVPGELHAGGRLQALAIRERDSLDTRNWEKNPTVTVGERLPVRWIDMEDIHAPEDDLRFRGFAAGCARFARGEGMWTGEDGIYFACTSGGKEKKGQIWRYVPSSYEGQDTEAGAAGVLELFVEPNDGTIVENADNLTVAPWGDLIVCEDGPGDQRLLGVTPAGEIYTLALNTLSNSEMAGVTFSPDGSTLFVNIQHDGLTIAITGAWQDA